MPHDDEPNDRPRRRREPERSSSPTLWLVLAGVAAAMVLGCGGLGLVVFFGLTGAAKNAEKERQAKAEALDTDKIAALIDKPETMKGKTLRLKMKCGEQSLEEFAGQGARFWETTEKGQLEIVVKLPVESTTLPKAHWGDALIVEFTCTEGRLDRGNIASKVTRP